MDGTLQGRTVSAKLKLLELQLSASFIGKGCILGNTAEGILLQIS